MSLPVKKGDACAKKVCFDEENFGVNALCVHHCGHEPSCKTTCKRFGIRFVDPSQCTFAGSAVSKRDGARVDGNQKCQANRPRDPPSRYGCCRCDKFLGK